jgi:hypothetical protein
MLVFAVLIRFTRFGRFERSCHADRQNKTLFALPIADCRLPIWGGGTDATQIGNWQSAIGNDLTVAAYEAYKQR